MGHLARSARKDCQHALHPVAQSSCRARLPATSTFGMSGGLDTKAGSSSLPSPLAAVASQSISARIAVANWAAARSQVASLKSENVTANKARHPTGDSTASLTQSSNRATTAAGLGAEGSGMDDAKLAAADRFLLSAKTMCHTKSRLVLIVSLCACLSAHA
jgi:hypothetical protein